MDCPKCEGQLQLKSFGAQIEVLRCNTCFGLLVEPETLLNMRQEWMAEAFLDIGHPKVGREFDKIDEINCPECEVHMTKIVDPVQTHIWMEQCPSCSKIFLDAGEFSDLKYETLMDKLKGLFRGKRTSE
jgi:Zn-finger nucleic acid-binding protein